MKYLFKFKLLLFVVSLCLSCSGGGAAGEPSNPIPVPVATTLIFPDNNTECNEGIILSATESEVVFKWNASEDTDRYTVNLKNLNSGNITAHNSSEQELAIVLARGVPYEWSVFSKADGTTESAESDSWRFYNAGIAAESHPPFPADAIFPKMGSLVVQGTINLSWTTEDVDGDIVSYEIFMDTNRTPTTLIGKITTATISVTTVESNIYYWQVKTVDSQGNISTSPIFEFKVN
jgi:hypothetical protein